MARSVKPSLLLSLLLGSFLNGWAMAKDTVADGSAFAEENASATKTASVDDNRQADTVEGPVFRNAAPPATYPAYSKKDPWESVNRKIFSFYEVGTDNPSSSER